jgi:hypothetical protein
MDLPFSSPCELISICCGSGRDEEPAGKILRLIQIRLGTHSFEKTGLLVKQNRATQRESPTPVPQTQSAFRPRAQRNAFRHRDVHQQSGSGRVDCEG